MSTFLNALFNLHYGEDDRQKTLESVKGNISFKGGNLWVLACAILIASSHFIQEVMDWQLEILNSFYFYSNKLS